MQSCRSLMIVSVLLTGSVLGCGGVEASPPPEEEVLGNDALDMLSTNGLSTNGLSTNGLTSNDLQSGSFSPWFNANPSLNDQIMKYLILCALPPGATISYTDNSGTNHVWTGRLGLAANWSAGRPATELDEQVVSACLAAHANPYGLHVDFSIQGRDSVGQEISSSVQELQSFGIRESCFFGNLFRSQGVYAGNDFTQLASSQSTLRGCGLSRVNSGEDPACANIVRIGTCASQCTLDPSGRYYTQCVRQGVVYRPLTTRIQPSTLVTCGDGVCQPSEHCGSGNTPSSCGVDCGACP